MKSSKKIWIVLFFMAAAALLVAMLTPNLLRSRYAADEVSDVARMRKYAYAPTQVRSLETESESTSQSPEHNLIRKAELELTVADVNSATTRLRTITQQFSGQIDQVRLVSTDYEQPSGELHLRVPAEQLEAAMAAYKEVAKKVTHEQLDIQDVTRQSADNDARLRNLRAEEAQYLEIMKRAGSIKDTVAVTEKLAAVRGDIEQLQAEINVMSHDVAMSSVNILLRSAPKGSPLMADWHPLADVHVSIKSLLSGVSSWVSFVVGALILLPAILLWSVTVAVAGFAVFWIFTRLARRLGAKPAASA